MTLSEAATEQLGIDFLNTSEKYKEYDEELKRNIASFLDLDKIEYIKDKREEAETGLATSRDALVS